MIIINCYQRQNKLLKKQNKLNTLVNFNVAIYLFIFFLFNTNFRIENRFF